MADTKITDLTPLVGVLGEDEIYVVDKSDTTDGAAGTSKKAKSENLPISTATTQALGNKVDKVAGKGLSEEDYTTTEKNKLAGIEAGAEVNEVSAAQLADKADIVHDHIDKINEPGTTINITPYAEAMHIYLHYNTGGNVQITEINNGFDGQKITIFASDQVSFNGATIEVNTSPIRPGQLGELSNITLMRFDGVWREISLTQYPT